MPKFRVVIEDTQITLRSKVFDAATASEAESLAKLEDWSGSDWQDFDSSTSCGIREDQTRRVDDEGGKL